MQFPNQEIFFVGLRWASGICIFTKSTPHTGDSLAVCLPVAMETPEMRTGFINIVRYLQQANELEKIIPPIWAAAVKDAANHWPCIALVTLQTHLGYPVPAVNPVPCLTTEPRTSCSLGPSLTLPQPLLSPSSCGFHGNCWACLLHPHPHHLMRFKKKIITRPPYITYLFQ